VHKEHEAARSAGIHLKTQHAAKIVFQVRIGAVLRPSEKCTWIAEQAENELAGMSEGDGGVRPHAFERRLRYTGESLDTVPRRFRNERVEIA
jgi:hypothetical protein